MTGETKGFIERRHKLWLIREKRRLRMHSLESDAPQDWTCQDRDFVLSRLSNHELWIWRMVWDENLLCSFSRAFVTELVSCALSFFIKGRLICSVLAWKAFEGSPWPEGYNSGK